MNDGKCKRKGCRSRHNTAVWLIDRVPFCNSCFTAWSETHFLDEHSVIRLSNRERDFPERDYVRRQETLPA